MLPIICLHAPNIANISQKGYFWHTLPGTGTVFQETGMTKDEIRAEVKRRLGVPGVGRVLPDRTLELICASDEWRGAGRVLLYSPLPDELDTGILIDRAMEEGKGIILPAVDGDDIRLLAYNPHTSLRKGRFGISEPDDGAEEILDFDSIGLAFIPGRAFTPGGDRLGRGRGYYDRLLPRLSCPLWGLALPPQVFSSLPVDPWDVRMDKVFW